jgi:hypothetical protein
LANFSSSAATEEPMTAATAAATKVNFIFMWYFLPVVARPFPEWFQLRGTIAKHRPAP